jgi:hypothetical protein
VVVEPSLVVVSPSLVVPVSESVESALVDSLPLVTSEPVVGLQRLHCHVPSAEHSHVEQSPSPDFEGRDE